MNGIRLNLSVKCASILLMSVSVCVCLRLIMSKSLSIKILLLIAVMILVCYKKAYTTPHQPNTGRMLQVELRMPESWKKIVIGPKLFPENYKISREDPIRRRRS